MTVREFIRHDREIDVYDDVCEALAIAFVGPLELTPEGEAHFSEVLGYEIEIVPGDETWSGSDHAYVLINHEELAATRKIMIKCAREFFESAAGYCSEHDYDKWFCY